MMRQFIPGWGTSLYYKSDRGARRTFYMVGHLFQNYDTIYVRFFFHVYLQSFLPHDIRAFYCHAHLRSFLLCGVFIPKYMTIFLQTRIYMRTKKAHLRYKQACLCGVTESCRIRSTELYRHQKTPFMNDGAEK